MPLSKQPAKKIKNSKQSKAARLRWAQRRYNESTSKNQEVVEIEEESDQTSEDEELTVMPMERQSRRAASKEALKNMHRILDNSSPLEIQDDDDDDVVISLPPPAKRTKVASKKTLQNSDVARGISDIPLELDCWVEPLQVVQLEWNRKIDEETNLIQSKCEELINASNGTIIHQDTLVDAVEINEQVSRVLSSGTTTTELISTNITTTNEAATSYQLVMDPRLGLVALANNASTSSVTPASVAIVSKPDSSSKTAKRARTSIPNITPAPAPPAPLSKKRVAATPSNQAPLPQLTTVYPCRGRVNKVQGVTPAPSISSPTSALRPAESTVTGGLANIRTYNRKVVDLTDDSRSLADCKEISFNKLQGKTYPSLVVVARPYLRVQDVNSDRPRLDSKVKSVLMHPATKFTEWLIQQGLVRSEQKCSIHPNNPLKLGMYSDVSKFPYSGGYVWISECCPQRFVSVFSGSIFEGSPHPPMVILKLIYHWACQTNIQNVIQWVKVDNLYVKGMYSWLRSVCTVAIQSHISQIGGPGYTVEVGVISLGTTSQDGNQRQVKVEVLGILETTTQLIRLRAVEPILESDGKNYKKRFLKILEPLVQWVHPASIIVTDLTVDKATLETLGFNKVIQNVNSEGFMSNRVIMSYLRRIVPRMFQNTLSLLSRQIIQQFLDELVWREWFGITSLNAFDYLVSHLAEQTRHDSGTTLIIRLNKVVLNPFKNWAVPTNKKQIVVTKGTAPDVNTIATPAPPKLPVEGAVKRYGRARKQDLSDSTSGSMTSPGRPTKSTSPDMPSQLVPIEHYYYGTIARPTMSGANNVVLNVSCPICKKIFTSNIELMTHLFQHAHGGTDDTAQYCRYCLTSTPNHEELVKHVNASHPFETKHGSGFSCLICETFYNNAFLLGKHMSKMHAPLELPYQCGTCGYQCSNHKQAVDHFYNFHYNGPTIQCPFCLKSTTIYTSFKNIVQNVNYFIQHLQKHQKKKCARKCSKCNLWFVQKDILKEHTQRMHTSQRGKPGLQPWPSPRFSVMVPKSVQDKSPSDGKEINFSTMFFKVSKQAKCKECGLEMDTPKHFSAFQTCQKVNCQYSTCCSNAMLEHVTKCAKQHEPDIAEDKLPYEMFCICGFSHSDGNLLARHLAICEKKSAYSSLQSAKGATARHSMLDVLGLVRKNDEKSNSSSSDEKRPRTRKRTKKTAKKSDDEDDLPLTKRRKTPVEEDVVVLLSDNEDQDADDNPIETLALLAETVMDTSIEEKNKSAEPILPEPETILDDDEQDQSKNGEELTKDDKQDKITKNNEEKN